MFLYNTFRHLLSSVVVQEGPVFRVERTNGRLTGTRTMNERDSESKEKNISYHFPTQSVLLMFPLHVNYGHFENLVTDRVPFVKDQRAT